MEVGVGEAATVTVRFLDRGGAWTALAALSEALRLVDAPRSVADDVRLAAELVLDRWLSAGPGPDGAVTAIAGEPGRVVVELRSGPLGALELPMLAALVDEVDVTRRDGTTEVLLARSWVDGDD